MFGAAVDYLILKPLAHRRNLATDSDRARLHLHYGADDALAYLEKARTLYFGNQLPVDRELGYLDIGCGTGELSIGLSLRGVEDVCGIDVVERHVTIANEAARVLQQAGRPKFMHISSEDFSRAQRFDVVIALAVMEHAGNPGRLLRDIRDLLTPTGRAFVSMTPFHGPFGDLMGKSFRVQIPWRGVLFSEKAILRIRREFFRPDEALACYQDVPGGLNLMRVGQYLRHIKDAGLKATHRFDPHFRHYPRYWMLCPISSVLTRIPILRDYCTVNVYSVLQRAD